MRLGRYLHGFALRPPRRQRLRPRRTGRDIDALAGNDAGLLAQPRGNGEGDPRRMAPFGRHRDARRARPPDLRRSEEHTSELQSIMRNSYAVFCLKKKKTTK